MAQSDETTLVSEGHMRIKRCRHGPMLYNSTDSFIGRSLDLYGEYSEAEAAAFEKFLHPGMVAIDVGANIGCFSIFMARRVAPEGAVIAIEPQRIIYQTLCANAAMNGITNIHAIHAAAGEEAGTIIVPAIDYAASGNFGGVELGSHDNGEGVPLTAIDSLPLPACHLIKIDVEGMEGRVLEGAKQTIEKHKPALYVENDRQEKSPALIEALFKADYRLYWHLPPLYNPNNFFANKENVFGNTGSLNMVGLPKSFDAPVSGLTEITSPEDWPL